jgi:predicted nucleic acid-binding Zn ribbon protein
MSASNRRPPPPDACPQCGATVPDNARACPECGACDETGWSEKARYDALDLPNADFDYDEFVRGEFGPEKGRRGRPRWWWIAVALILVVWLLGVLI